MPALLLLHEVLIMINTVLFLFMIMVLGILIPGLARGKDDISDKYSLLIFPGTLIFEYLLYRFGRFISKDNVNYITHFIEQALSGKSKGAD